MSNFTYSLPKICASKILFTINYSIKSLIADNPKYAYAKAIVGFFTSRFELKDKMLFALIFKEPY